MSDLKSKILANLAGQGWVALVQLIVLPIYLNLLGVEAYGIIGFYAALLATVQVLDLGLGQTMTREIARGTAVLADGPALHDLVTTVERTYWVMGVAIVALLILAAPLAARQLINAEHLSPDTLQLALVLMAVLVALQLAINLYQCGLIGLEKFAPVNWLRAGIATVAALGGVLVLLYVSRSITALFAWHGCVYAVHAVVAKLLLRANLPPAGRISRFRVAILKYLWRFAAGMSGISVVAVVISQLDKWVLINLLTLENFGYYAVASTVSTSLYLLISPLFGVLFSKFSFLVATDNREELERLYRAGTQIMLVAIVPAAFVFSLFSYEVLSLWTRNAQVSGQAAPIVTILVIGTAVNGIMNVPYALQLAFGWTKLVLGINLIAMVFLVPALLALTLQFGPTGAAVAWLGYNLAFACLAIPLMHHRFLVGEAVKWLKRDVLLGVIAVLVILGAARIGLPTGMPEAAKALYIAVSYVLSALAAALCGAQTREWVLGHARRIYLKMG